MRQTNQPRSPNDRPGIIWTNPPLFCSCIFNLEVSRVVTNQDAQIIIYKHGCLVRVLIQTLTNIHISQIHSPPYTFTYRLMLEMNTRGNQGERCPSRLLELICQVCDPQIPVFNYLVGSCLSSACAFSVSQTMASSIKCILQWYSCLSWHPLSYSTPRTHPHCIYPYFVECMLRYLTIYHY